MGMRERGEDLVHEPFDRSEFGMLVEQVRGRARFRIEACRPFRS
jgi:hypothetical protein